MLRFGSGISISKIFKKHSGNGNGNGNGNGSAALQVDWSVISLSAIASILRQLLADMLGAPAQAQTQVRRLSSTLDVTHLYRANSSIAAKRPRFLIKAVIYDMPCFIQKSSSSTKFQSQSTPQHHHKWKWQHDSELSSSEALLLAGRDWTNVLHMDTPIINSSSNNGFSDNSNANAISVSAVDVMQRLGVESIIPGLQGRIADANRIMRMKKLEEKQKLEKVMGTGDSVRAKYMDKIRQKKLKADFTREQQRFSDTMSTAASESAASSTKSWNVTPGSPALVRYLEERGIYQALISQGGELELNNLLVELRDYKFQQMRNLEISENMENSVEDVEKMSKTYVDILSSFCAIWSLPPWQVLLVVGDGAQNEALYKAVKGSQYFICKVGMSPFLPERAKGLAVKKLENMDEKFSVRRLLDWYRKLSEGKLQNHDEPGFVKNQDNAIHHFSVRDMTELKWIVEDMNGVSYRSTTFVQGFN